MAKYDPLVIQKFADRLYTRARSIVISYTAAGVLFGAPLLAVALKFLTRSVGESSFGLGLGELLLLALVGGGIGFAVGTERAFMLRLQAQVALCQLQIEANTRGAQAAAA